MCMTICLNKDDALKAPVRSLGLCEFVPLVQKVVSQSKNVEVRNFEIYTKKLSQQCAWSSPLTLTPWCWIHTMTVSYYK